MSGATRESVDIAGGKIVTSQAKDVFVNGEKIVVLGSKVEDHGDHKNVTMTESSSSVFANGIGVCREGDIASCNHVATGSSDVFVGD